MRETSRAIRWLENTLLCIIVAVIILRAMVIEVPLVDQLQTQLFLSSEVVSLLVSTVLLFCIGLWFLVSILANQFRWRDTGFGVAFGVFVFAGVLSAFFASDKRAAVTDLVVLATPMLTGLVLVQLLNSRAKIRMVLLLILSVGVAGTVQCMDQKMDSNQTLIKDYEADPVKHLEKHGIEPDSMEHWMYEHRLYSSDIRGFLMTSNAAASFFLMAVFSGLGLCLQAACKKMSQETMAALICYIIASFIVVFGLFMTESKGGIGAFGLSLILLAPVLFFGKTVWKWRGVVGVVGILLMAIASVTAIRYGTQHGRLPGGNSMLVRWQYWQSTVQMIRDHILTGVGGGNFPKFYTHYKIPAALETVQNPHNWILSILSQYGPLGLIGLVTAFSLPLYKAFGSLHKNSDFKSDQCMSKRSHLWMGLLVSVSAALLLIRPLIVDVEFLSQRPDIRSAAYLVLYLFPAGVVILSFIILNVASWGDASVNGKNNRLTIALICGLIAVLIHNLIDFAIFEPGNWSVFWLLVAIVTSLSFGLEKISGKVILFNTPKRMTALAVLLMGAFIYLSVALVPPIFADHYFKRSMFDDVRRIELIKGANAVDRLSSKTAYKSGLMFYQGYRQQSVKDRRFLDVAIDQTQIAAARNPADFKPHRLLAQIYVAASEQDEEQQKDLEKAFEHFLQAIDRYPGSGRLHYDLATVAEQLGRIEVALIHYRAAVEIEDAYREQFRVMYPERETVISRLGIAAYKKAKSKLLEIN